jgi:hypothetical protein
MLWYLCISVVFGHNEIYSNNKVPLHLNITAVTIMYYKYRPMTTSHTVIISRWVNMMILAYTTKEIHKFRAWHCSLVTACPILLSFTQENVGDLHRVGRDPQNSRQRSGKNIDLVKNMTPYCSSTFFPLVAFCKMFSLPDASSHIMHSSNYTQQ